MLKVLVIGHCEFCGAAAYLYTGELDKLILISSTLDGVAPIKFITPRVATGSNYLK